jgi:hypothetical protein
VDKILFRPKPSMHSHLDRLDWQEDSQVRVGGWIFFEHVALKYIDVALDGQPLAFLGLVAETS